MTLRYPGEFDAYVPQATGQVIAHIRDPKTYRLNQYVQLVKTDTSVGVYMKLEVDQFQRFVTVDEDVWADGAKSPEQQGNLIRHDFVEFQTIRREDHTYIGWKTIQQASYNILMAHLAAIQNQHMAKRTQRVITRAETAGNWGSNTGAANTVNGGYGQWDLASDQPTDPKYLAIKKTLDAVAAQLILTTNGQVDFEDPKSNLMLLISPNAAIKMSQSAEIYHYLAHGPYAMGQIEGKVKGRNAKWGLPDQLYGWELIVENAVRVSERPKASGTEASTVSGSPIPRRFIKGDDSAIACCRPGSLDGEYGAPSFSTFQLYYFGKELEIETLDETKDRRTLSRVVSDVTEVIAAPLSGYLITDILSTV